MRKFINNIYFRYALLLLFLHNAYAQYCLINEHSYDTAENIITYLLIAAFVYEIYTTNLDLQTQNRKLKAVSLCDELTGLPNFRLFVDRFTHFNNQRDKNGTLLYFDLNSFKQINDQQGHACGDDALKKTAAVLLANVRSGDTVARLHGDEFVVLLTHGEHEKVITRILDSFPVMIGSKKRPLYISMGAVQFNTGPEVLVDLLDQADKSMYMAKSKSKEKNLGSMCHIVDEGFIPGVV